VGSNPTPSATPPALASAQDDYLLAYGPQGLTALRASRSLASHRQSFDVAPGDEDDARIVDPSSMGGSMRRSTMRVMVRP
jgi:hypothetical protein